MNNFETNREKLKNLQDKTHDDFRKISKLENEIKYELTEYIIDNELLNENVWELTTREDYNNEIVLESYEDEHPELIKIIRNCGLEQYTYEHFMIVLKYQDCEDFEFESPLVTFNNDDGVLRITFHIDWNEKEQYKIFDFIKENKIPISYQNIEDKIKEFEGKARVLKNIIKG